MIGIIMVVSSLSLLYLETRYAAAMVMMRKEQFDENVFRSLDQASRDMEREETIYYLHEVADGSDLLSGNNANLPQVGRFAPRIAPQLQEKVRNAYLYERDVLDEVVLRVLYSASELDFAERLDNERLQHFLRLSLEGNGIMLPFHYIVYDAAGNEVCRDDEYDGEGSDYCYTQTLFRNDPSGKMGVVNVHFPDRRDYILGVTGMVMPALFFTLVILATFLVSIYLVVRQKRLSEMKNDFIHNLTHEFKTPISTISIAAQMLADRGMKKTEEMYQRYSDIIVAETKRLRFQVEKVLQMSLYDSGNIALNLQPLEVNQLIDGVVETFSLKVRQNGGEVDTHLDALESEVQVDEMHFTNVIFNLMDNAVKYKRDDVPLHLVVRTWNDGDRLYISIQDNGIGIRREDQKRIFEKFYRVHTGDKHDVKGFGLGLAYVHKMVLLHKGSIRVNSEYGSGTIFTIQLPFLK